MIHAAHASVKVRVCAATLQVVIAQEIAGNALTT